MTITILVLFGSAFFTDENLTINLTEFIDSKMCDSDGGGSDDLNVQLEPSAQLDSETTQAPST